MEKINYIDGNKFLKNIFVRLIEIGKISVSIDDIFHLEYYYLKLLSNDINILNNSKENILDFINSYEEYLDYNPETGIINISKEEDFREELLFNNALIDDKYKKAVKKLINSKKRKLNESIY